jgi:hypothetical protein
MAMKRILKCDQPTAMADALEIQEAYNIKKSKLYDYRIWFLVQSNQV